MERYEDENSDFKSVIDNLFSMFGHIMTREVIATLVESCEGDLNLSMDAIMNITNDGNVIPKADTASSSKIKKTKFPTQPSKSSYAAHTSQNKGAVPRQTQRNIKPVQDFWTDQTREIINNYNKGYRILIIMRGLPGSGKSYLSKLLVESMVGPTFANYKNHIFSTDDYFMVRGQYLYDRFKLPLAHSWNQDRVKMAAYQGVSPIIVDNTNVESWEMRPYAVEGVKNGYMIEVVEPNTPWAKKANQLFKKSIHNVPFNTIKRMLDNYSENETGARLMRSFGLSYPSNMIPPVQRIFPPMLKKEEVRNSNYTPDATAGTNQDLPRNPLNESLTQRQNLQVQEVDTKTEPKCEQNVAEEDVACAIQPPENIDEITQEEEAKQKFVIEAQKRLDELEKFEEEWDKGEKWDDNDHDVPENTLVQSSNAITSNSALISTTITSTDVTATSSRNVTSVLIANMESKPQRKERNGLDSESRDDNQIKSINNCKDQRDITWLMPPWVHPNDNPIVAPKQDIPIETTTSSTCVEMYDTNISGKHKVIIACSRDINEFYIPPEKEKIPVKRMLDKSTMTTEGIVMTFHCPQKERHFIAFRNFFKHIERSSLRYIFDNCCGDVNWAVENILAGGVQYKLKSSENDQESDEEEEPDSGNELSCTCLADYEIVPNETQFDALELALKTDVVEKTTEVFSPQLEKKKRDTTISEESMQLKKQIEQNVVISDKHYSQHCLKIRKMYRGEPNIVENQCDQPSTSGTPDTTVKDISIPAVPDVDSSDEEDCAVSNFIEPDRIVNINVGRSFIKDLDDMFGRNEMEYPDNINYNISIPTSLLNEINALWIESMMFQLDENAKKSAAMVKQDEEFARQLALKEQELSRAGKEPEVPDFKEIMDLEFAITLHIKDSSEWRNNIPTDLAAKMTQDKLYNLFPEIAKDTLLEMLHAHDNNFKTTVEVLLTSMGRTDILESEDGLNRFVMNKELERREKVLEEEKKALSEEEWPVLTKDQKVDISTVQELRDQAEKHLIRRNMQMQKAEEYVRRGMTQVAYYCSDLANFHKTKYEQANSRAVATLIQYHANNNSDGETVDLHYFRVKEAKEAMDLFIDSHIQRLRERNKRSIILYFITGRGLHSPGLPKVKPACIKRLRERGLNYSECNPGLLRSRISCEDKLTYQIP